MEDESMEEQVVNEEVESNAEDIGKITQMYMQKIDELTTQLEEQQKQHERELKQIIESIGQPAPQKSDLEKAVEKATEKVNKYRKEF